MFNELNILIATNDILIQQIYRRYKIPYNEFLTAKSIYETANNNYQTKQTLLASYENQLRTYGVKLDDVNLTASQINQKTSAFVVIENANNDDLVVLANVYGNLSSQLQSLSGGSCEINTSKYAINQETYYINGGNINSAEYQRYPFVSHGRYNISGTGKDYPAEIWVEYKIPGTEEFGRIGGDKVNNECEKAKKFEEYQKKAKQLIDNDSMYFTELCLKYAGEKYPLTGVGSLDGNDKRQSDYISQCLKNPNLLEPELINENVIESVKYLGEFGLEVSGLQTIGRSWGSLIAYWTGYITNDLYLTEIGKQNLKSDLLAVSQEVNILGKLNKMKKFSTNIFKKRVTDLLAANIKWSKVNKPDSSKIQNDKLWNILDQNYRDGAKIGNGSTADSIRYQKATGLLVGGKDHIIKGTKDSQGLKNLIEGGVLSSYDKSVASKVLDDLTNALNGN